MVTYNQESWVNSNNPNQQTLLFRGSINRSELPTGFASQGSNPLISMSQGGGTSEFNFTVLWSYNRDMYEAAGGDDATLSDLFPDIDVATIQPHISRTTYKAWENKQPVSNPSTGEVLMFEGRPVYQYETLTIGAKPVVTFDGHNCPAFIKQNVGV